MAKMFNIDGKVVQIDDGSGLETFTVAPNKARKPNWTEREVMALLDEYSRRKHVLKPKVGVVVSMNDRQTCWSEIADVINTSEGVNSCYRSVKEVQKKFENLSNRMRTEFATAKVEAAFRLSETSVALNNILNGDGVFDPTVFARGYNLVKQERDEDEDHFEKNDESHGSEEASDDRMSREPTVPVLNIPFKANNRFPTESLDSYASLAPRSNQIYSVSNQESAPVPVINTFKSAKISDYEYGEMVFPSGESVYINPALQPRSSQTSTQMSTNQNNHGINSNGREYERSKPNPDTSAKLRQAMLKRTNSGTSSNNGQSTKRTKFENVCHCPHFSDESVAKLYKQVLILKKRTLKQKFEKQEIEKEKLKLETEKLKIETEKLKLEAETAKIKRDEVFFEMQESK